jgi:hypothetical protein
MQAARKHLEWCSFNDNRSTSLIVIASKAIKLIEIQAHVPPSQYKDSKVTALYFDWSIRNKELKIHKRRSYKFLWHLSAALFGLTTQHTHASFQTNAILSTQHKALYITSQLQGGSENLKESSLT